MNNKKLRLGLFCSTSDNTLSTNRTFKLASLSKEKLFETVSKNLADLLKILQLCKERGITMFRLGNSIVPFASHPSFDEGWWGELTPMFEKAAKIIEQYDIRLTIHPGQFIQLGSNNPSVVASSLKELSYCFRVLKLLGDKPNSIVTLHLGGGRGDKEETMERFVRVFEQNSWLKRYLALENDEYNFNAKETLTVCQRCEIPMVFDIFHHTINKSDISWEQIKESWKSRRPKLHISSQGDGKKGMHADFIDEDDFKKLAQFLGEDLYEVDIMIEAKAKERAIEKIFEWSKRVLPKMALT